MLPDVRSAKTVIAALAVICLALFAWTYLGFVVPFRAAAAGRQILDARVGGYESADVVEMLQFLRDHPDAAAIQRALYLSPELVFPGILAGLLFLLLRSAEPGGFFFGRPIPPGAVSVILFLPVLYGVIDYAENIAGLLLFPPAAPSDWTIGLLSAMLPILVRLKFALLVIIAILLVRLAVYRYLSASGPEEP